MAWQFNVGALQAQSVVVGYSGIDVSGALRRVIEKQKLWQKQGLDVKAVYFGSGAVMAQAMVAGDILLSDSDAPAQLGPRSRVLWAEE